MNKNLACNVPGLEQLRPARNSQTINCECICDALLFGVFVCHSSHRTICHAGMRGIPKQGSSNLMLGLNILIEVVIEHKGISLGN